MNNHIFVISGNHDESGPILNNSGVYVGLDPELRWVLPFVLDWGRGGVGFLVEKNLDNSLKR